MVRARDPRKVREYVALCDRDQPVEEQTVWLLRALDVFDQEVLAEHYQAAGIGQADQVNTSNSKQLRALIETVRRGLSGWKNHRDSNGGQVAFGQGPDGFATDDTLRVIRADIVVELSGEISTSETVGTAEAGK